MAYCSKCGAYIPDGQTKCLACGYDAAAQAASQSAYAYEESAAARDYDAERAQKQQENRRWAEEEYARRRKEKEAQEQAAREKEEQRAKAQERIRQKAAEYNENTRSESGFTYTEGNSKVFATLSYISLGFMLQKLFLPEDEYAKFHSKQGERLFVCGLVAEIIGSIFGLAWIPILLRIGYTIKGINNAKNGEVEELPFINDIFKKK